MNASLQDVVDGFATPATGIDRILSDAQSGVARGALDAAIALRIQHGGACATDRRADDGMLDPRYETRDIGGGFAVRCAYNIKASDGTLLFSLCPEAEIDGRTAYARDLAKKLRQGSAHVRLTLDEPAPGMVRSIQKWLARYRVTTLHVTGPLEIKEPGVAEATTRMLRAVLR